MLARKEKKPTPSPLLAQGLDPSLQYTCKQMFSRAYKSGASSGLIKRIHKRENKSS